MHYTFSALWRSGQSKKEIIAYSISLCAFCFLNVNCEIQIENKILLVNRSAKIDRLEDIGDFLRRKCLRIPWQLKSR